MVDYNIITFGTSVVCAVEMHNAIALQVGKPIIYHKAFDINEFIGEKLADIKGIRTAHYFPVCFDSKVDDELVKQEKYRVGSYDFKKPGIEYRRAFNLPFYYGDEDSFNYLLESCKDDKNRGNFIDEYLEMMALDTYMGQIDRASNIFYEFHPNGEIHLSPLFDYEMSMEVHNFDFGYTNDFFQLFTEAQYQVLLSKHPQFEGMLKGYLDISLEDVITKVFKERKFNLRGFDMDTYKYFDEASHKRLEKILR